MKKKIFKRILSVMLVGVMALSLIACGNSEDGSGTIGGFGGSGGKGDKDAANDAAKQNVYSYQDIDLGINLNEVNMHTMRYVNGRIVMMMEDWNGAVFGPGAGARAATMEETAPVEEGASSESAAPEDAPVEMPAEEIVNQGPVYVLLSVNPDGSDKKTVILDAIQEESDAEGEEADEKSDVTYSYSYITRIEVGTDGSVYAMQEAYKEDYSDPENPIFENCYDIMRWDAEGKLIWKQDVMPFLPEGVEYFYPSQMFITEDGNVTFISWEGTGACLDADGNLVATIDNSASMQNGNMGSIITGSDGTLYAISYNDDYTKQYISTMDIATGTMGEKQELPGTMTNYSFHKGLNTDFVLSNNMGIYTYSIGDKEPAKLMDFINSDLPANNLNNIVILDDEHMIATYNDYTEWAMHLAYFTKVKPEDVPDKSTIVLGCNYLDYEVRKDVVKFNKSNTQYRIAIKDYSSYSTMEDYMASYNQLNNDILSNQMPDILLVDMNMDIDNYISKGLIANLSELIASDPELSQKEFLTNIFDAFSVDGKLYTLVPSFSIQTMIAKKAQVGDRTGWTMEEFLAFEETLPEGTQMFGSNMLRDSFLYQVMNYLGNDFIDPKTGKCSFDTPEFISLLEYANRFMAEFPEDYWENYDYTQYENMYREDRAILMELYASSIRDMKYSIRGQFGEPVTFIGFPSSDGSGSLIQPNSKSFVISARSKNIPGAWEFVRYYLTDEFQKGENLYDFPVSKEAFLAKAQEATQKPYYLDENGNKVEYDDTYWINNEEVIMEPFTQEEVDQISEFIFSIKKVAGYNNDINKIITEEAQYFFEGQKSAQEVATVIQSRAQIFIDENR